MATLLVVDDDAALRDVLVAQLSSLGHQVLTAGSAQAALAMLESIAPDLVLSDVHMDGMSGVELCRRLKGDPRFQLTPLILITGVSDLPARVAGLDAGADDFFGKPFDFVELQTRIASLLRIKRLQGELELRNQLLRTLFGRYVSEAIAAEVVRDPERYLSVGGEKREATILFADLRGFTPLADGLDPNDTVEILNAFLTMVVEVVFEHGGTLDKFRGDGVMAVFGAPLARPDDPARAVRCAVDLQRRIGALAFPRFPDLKLHMGVGINTGVVVAGPIGSPRRMDYTVIGGEVNLAQRFEANAGPGQVLITGNTHARVKDLVRVRELGALRVRGKSRGVPAYDVLDVVGPGARAASPEDGEPAR